MTITQLRDGDSVKGWFVKTSRGAYNVEISKDYDDEKWYHSIWALAGSGEVPRRVKQFALEQQSVLNHRGTR
jgi:hypothetical protein